jgi:hypothetical protein
MKQKIDEHIFKFLFGDRIEFLNNKNIVVDDEMKAVIRSVSQDLYDRSSKDRSSNFTISSMSSFQDLISLIENQIDTKQNISQDQKHSVLISITLDLMNLYNDAISDVYTTLDEFESNT